MTLLTFHETPSTFPISRRPVIHIKTVALNHRSDDSHLQLWGDRIDQIIKTRHLDYKGIIHTVSYSRAKWLLDHSEFARYMLLPESRTTQEVVDRFRRADTPSILVSPSVTTGLDFRDDQARWQIIGKLGFPDTRGAVAAARLAQDKDYGPYIAMVGLVQAVGRLVRSESDWGESLITDDNVDWFLRRYSRFAPKSFLESYKSVLTVPKPMWKEKGWKAA